jgi:hypothetical protein
VKFFGIFFVIRGTQTGDTAMGSSRNTSRTPASIIDELGQAALDAREARRELHEAMRDARGLLKDIHTALASARTAVQDIIAADVASLIASSVETEIAALGTETSEQIRMASAKIERTFNELADIFLGNTKKDRQMGEEVPARDAGPVRAGPAGQGDRQQSQDSYPCHRGDRRRVGRAVAAGQQYNRVVPM